MRALKMGGKMPGYKSGFTKPQFQHCLKLGGVCFWAETKLEINIRRFGKEFKYLKLWCLTDFFCINGKVLSL